MKTILLFSALCFLTCTGNASGDTKVNSWPACVENALPVIAGGNDAPIAALPGEYSTPPFLGGDRVNLREDSSYEQSSWGDFGEDPPAVTGKWHVENGHIVLISTDGKMLELIVLILHNILALADPNDQIVKESGFCRGLLLEKKLIVGRSNGP